MAKNTKTKTTKVKKEISVRTVGRNVLMKIDGESFSRAVKSKEDREAIKEKVLAYNKRNSLKKEKEIIKFMLENKSTPTERKEVVKKAVAKKTVKPKTKKLTKAQEIEKAKKLLEENNYSVNEKRAKQARVSRRGEY